MTTSKEILLINLPPGRGFDYNNAGKIYPATGIMVIGSLLRQRGFSVTLIDGAVDPQYETRVIERVSDKTLFVGFSAMTSQIMMVYDLAKTIKHKLPSLPIVVGGIHPTLFPEQTVDNPYIDIAVVNEASRTVFEIIDSMEGKKPLTAVNGIAFRESRGNIHVTPAQPLDEIDQIPYFDFDLLGDVSPYLNAQSVYEREFNTDGKTPIRLMPILTGLGCCFRCAFCINVILKRKYRMRTAESIVSEMQRLQRVYKANAFLFLDEDFCISKKRLKEFIGLVKEKNLDFSGRIWTRVSYFHEPAFEQLVPEMEAAGIKSIAMGAESGSQRMLDYINKDIKLSDIKLAAKVLAKGNITPRFSFIVGMEGETRAETIATFKLCAELLKINPRTDIAGPFVFRYYPGSTMFKRMVEQYNVTLPETIDEWSSSLNDDGSLIVDNQQWTWKGFFQYTERMSKYISLYINTLRNPEYRNKPAVSLLKILILLRIKYGEYFYKTEDRLWRFVKLIRNFGEK